MKRVDLANDPLNLLAVDGPTNAAEGAGDAATWLPPNKAYRCSYVARQVAVKARYGWWVTLAEHDAIGRILASCPGQKAPAEPGSPREDRLRRKPMCSQQPAPLCGGDDQRPVCDAGAGRPRRGERFRAAITGAAGK